MSERTKANKGIKVIKKSNQLIEARYRFDVWETRMFLSVLSCIRKEDTDFQTYRIWYRDVIKIFDLKSHQSYGLLREAVKSLMQKTLFVNYQDGGFTRERAYHIIRTSDYLKEGQRGDGVESQEFIDVTIEPEMMPLLLQLQKNFTAYDLRNVSKLGATGFTAPSQVSAVNKPSGVGTKTASTISSYTGTLAVVPVGLVPATVTTRSIITGETQCVDVAVQGGAQVLRFQLFNADTSHPADLDLEVFNGPQGTGTSMGSSGGSTSDEVVTVMAPAAGMYSGCVTGFDTGAGVTYSLSGWVVGPAVGPQTLRASSPSRVYAGGTATVALAWSVPAGQRYLGNVTYVNTTVPATPVVLGSTIVFVDR